MARLVLIAGLGNPGPEYEKTRHNIGFRALDYCAERWNASGFSKKFKGLLAEATVHGHTLLLIKPQTYMNLSGESVAAAANFYKIPPSDVVVLVDEVDLPPGRLRLRPKGGSGGHNGLKSVIQCLGSEEFPRLRFGVGRHPQIPTDRFVLSQFTKAEMEVVQQQIATGLTALEVFLKDGIERAMEIANRKEKEDKNEP